MTDPTKRLFLVLGMHRSGTSAIARGLMALGAELGENLLGPIPADNDKGFFEDLDIQALNDAILRHFGRDWHSLATIPAEQLRALPQVYFDHARRLLQAKTATRSIFAFKDPRLARLLPFWTETLSAFDGEVACLIAVRHPMSVAKSLHRRNGIPVMKGIYLWQLHTLGALTEIDPRWRKIAVDYDTLLDAPRPTLTRIAHAFGLPPPPDAAAASYARDFLDGGLRHARCGDEDLADVIAPPVGLDETFTFARRLARDEASLSDPKTTGELKRRAAALNQLFPPSRVAVQTDLSALTLQGDRGARKLEYRTSPDQQQRIARIFQARELDIAKLARIRELMALVDRQRAAGRTPLIVDAYAQEGAATVFFALLFPDATIVSIEPDGAHFELLCRNVAGLTVAPLLARLGAGSHPAVAMEDILRRHGDRTFPLLARFDLQGDEKALFARPQTWLRDFPLVMFRANDQANPGTARCFMRTISAEERDFVIQADHLIALAAAL